jgi:hypothetical protein
VGTCDDEESPYFSCTLEGRVYPVGGKFSLGVRASANGAYDMEYDACDMENHPGAGQEREGEWFQRRRPAAARAQREEGADRHGDEHVHLRWLAACEGLRLPPQAMRSTSIRALLREKKLSGFSVGHDVLGNLPNGRKVRRLVEISAVDEAFFPNTYRSIKASHAEASGPAPSCRAPSTPSRRMAASSTRR